MKRFLFPLLVSTLSAADLQLSPTGPYQTPAGARDAARKASKPVRIVVAEGSYSLETALELGSEDSEVTWEAAPNAHPVFTGGAVITGWKETHPGLWQTKVDPTWRFQQLWINGQRATLARSPNRGFYHMRSQASTDIFPAPPTAPSDYFKELQYHSFITDEAAFAELSKISPEERSLATLLIPYTWEVHQYKVEALHAPTHAVKLQGPMMWQILVDEPDGRFWLENYRGALDQPGEWCLSPSGEVSYLAKAGENVAAARIIAPKAEKLLTIQGARQLVFRGLSFQHQNWVCPAGGHGDGQAAISIGGALELTDCRQVSFDHCEVAHLGSYGIVFRNGCHEDTIRHCHLHDLGAGGVKIADPSVGPGSSVRDATGGITVDDCTIQHGGRVFPSAVAILAGNSGDNVITHNEVGDFYYSAISLGWVWGYGESAAMRNRVEHNHLHHLGWGLISDMGGVYNLSPSFGTVVRNNHIHDVASYRYGGWGLYTDEGSTGVLMENNLVHDTSESSFHQHYGYYNIVRNNIFAFGGKAQLQRSRPEARLSFVLENNLIIWDPAVKLLDGTKYNWDYPASPLPGDGAVSYIMRNNLYWPLGGRMPEKLAEHWSWPEWQQSGRDGGSIVADPKFANVEARDFRLAADSPASKIGFQPWDLTLAGVRQDDAAWVALARQGWDYPNWKADSRPWPSPPFALPLETFEFTSVGMVSLPKMMLGVENQGDSIAVSEEVASPIPLVGGNVPGLSRRSLKLQDAPGLKQIYSPHFGLRPGWTTGTIHVAFDIRAAAAATWMFDLRDAEKTDYLAGIGLYWEAGTLAIKGSSAAERIEVPPDHWLRIEIVSKLGSGQAALKFTSEDGQVREIKQLPVSEKWQECGFAVWASLATSSTALFVDNLAFECDP